MLAPLPPRPRRRVRATTTTTSPVRHGLFTLALVVPMAACGSTSRSLYQPSGTSRTSPPPVAEGAQEPVPVSLEGEPGPTGGGKRSGGEHQQHVALSVGAIFQNEANQGDSGRIALEYEHLWPESWGLLDSRWGVGAMIEFDPRPVDALLFAAQLVYHPVPQACLVIAPGLIHDLEGADGPLLRLGMAWEFELGSHFSIAPQVFFDIQDAGKRSSVAALSFGYGF